MQYGSHNSLTSMAQTTPRYLATSVVPPLLPLLLSYAVVTTGYPRDAGGALKG